MPTIRTKDYVENQPTSEKNILLKREVSPSSSGKYNLPGRQVESV
jgi:hypothetical protein